MVKLNSAASNWSTHNLPTNCDRIFNFCSKPHYFCHGLHPHIKIEVEKYLILCKVDKAVFRPVTNASVTFLNPM